VKSLLIRFFLSFWLIIGITIGTAAVGGYWYAERVRDAYENFDLGDSLHEASAALNSAGREGLTIWLTNLPETRGLRVLVLDRSGKDLLNRPVPWQLRRVLERKRRIMPPHGRRRPDPENLMRARPLSQLIGPDGQRFSVVVIPSRDGPLADYGLSMRTIMLLLALMVSAAVSLLLARTMSGPVRKLRDATRHLAEGDLNSRVASSVGKRKDELGLLARDFDRMAGNLQRAAMQQIELSRNVSHELRSPLARLRVALELARRKAGNLTELDRIDAETERLDSLIGQILSYTRLDSLAEQDKQPHNLNDIIADVVADVNYECNAAGMQGISVTTDLSSSIDVLVHRESLSSAIENVLRNAVHHTQPNSQVLVSLHYEESDTALITVEDFGDGVPDQDIENLFEPFFRTQDPGTDIAGTGLGLAIARRAVQIHGGEISASNPASGGLRITIALPCQSEAES